MFIDKVKVHVIAGDGGNGKVSFRHERYVDRGGPDGGDGGDGGNVVVEASRNQNTLATYRYQKLIKAEDGETGGTSKKHGKNGKHLVIKVPVGTVIADEKGSVLADLHEDGQTFILAHGGKGGFGNAHFISSTRQAPRVAENGEEGDDFEAVLELKMIADVGLVGLPNAGKSTLLSVISNARPEIGDYPFTTLTPNLGVVDIGDNTSLLFADIPGLIEGASEGKGLGDQFLRHVERTSVLVHLIDVYTDDYIAAYKTIIKELAAYSVDLSKKPQIIVLTKIDGVDTEILDDIKKQLTKVVPKDITIHAVSSKSKTGLQELLFSVRDIVAANRKEEVVSEDESDDIPVIRHTADEEEWFVQKTDIGYQVTGRKIERLASRTRFGDSFGEERLLDILKKLGILRELRKQGIEPGNHVYFGKNEQNYLEY